jgi:hypothetical protein
MIMENGLLWFDDRKDVSTEQKIQNAVLFYQQKYGTKPDRCTINSDTPLQQDGQCFGRFADRSAPLYFTQPFLAGKRSLMALPEPFFCFGEG